MDDIAKHLREVAEINHPGQSATRQALYRGADEIDQLRAALLQATEALEIATAENRLSYEQDAINNARKLLK